MLPDLTGTFVDEGYIQLVQPLGCGGFAKVYKALDTTSLPEDPIYYAVKCMCYDAPGSRQVLLQAAVLEQEFRMHWAVRNQPGVAHLHRLFKDGEFVFMVLDFCPGGDMFDAIFTHKVYVDRPALVREAFLEVLDAVEQCHDKGIYHRDVKPSNILLCSAGTGKGIRLADFGLATQEEEPKLGRCGSMSYISPECADSTRTSYSPRESDLWALAVTLFTLVTATNPWPVASPSDAAYAAYRADPDNYLSTKFHLTPAANDLFRWCFSPDPATRPSIAQMRAAVLNIERFSLAYMIPRAPVEPAKPAHAPAEPLALNLSAIPSSNISSPALISHLPIPSSPISDSPDTARRRRAVHSYRQPPRRRERRSRGRAPSTSHSHQAPHRESVPVSRPRALGPGRQGGPRVPLP
ncbi:kinase-like domain-containing protein [Mycena galericulata]|nr:kinase-like domain-containing protein [Mycena galericulata]